MLQFGLTRGLAVRVNEQGLIQDEARHFQMQKQAKAEQEAKAKLFADDFDYNNAINEYDNPRIKEYARGIFQKMGNFVRENPGWEQSFAGQAQMKAYRHELKDNPELNRGIQSDAAHKSLLKDLAEQSKNPETFDKEAWDQKVQEWNKYTKYGHQGGAEAFAKEGNKEFTYQAPIDRVNTTNELMKIAQATEWDMTTNIGYGGVKQSVSEERKNSSANRALSSPVAAWVKRDYKQALEAGATKATTVAQFARELMDPFFKADKIDKGWAPPQVKLSGKDMANMTPSMWYTMHDKLANSNGASVDLGSGAMQATFANDLGEILLDGIKDPFGNPLNLGMRRAVATGMARVHKGVVQGDKPYAEFDALVRLPVSEFVALGKQYDDAIDELGAGQLTSGVSSQWEIRPEYEAKGIKKYIDNKSGKEFVEFPVAKKYDPYNVRLADNYSNAANVSQHKENPYDMGDGNKPATIVQEGVTYTLNPNTGQYE
ncbi:MAG: hypothetical protein IT212_07590 [Bacteroidia bacterium]|nr:hypothetical protein [Bacteroidia bacterium]